MDGGLGGTVTGNIFTGTVTIRVPDSRRGRTVPFSGTYSNTASGVTSDGHYKGVFGDSVVTFSAVGCPGELSRDHRALGRSVHGSVLALRL